MGGGGSLRQPLQGWGQAQGCEEGGEGGRGQRTVCRAEGRWPCAEWASSGM